MSNIEPTEEQRQAANALVTKTRIAEEDSIASRALARLLAEREHKLRESYVRIGVSTGQAERDALRAERDANIRLRVAAEDRARMLQGLANIAHTESDTLRADLARANDERVRANGYLLAAQKSEMAMKGQLADARARVAELEAVTDEISDMRAQLHIADTREAQHLADIKALQILLHRWVSSYVGGRHGEDARSLVDVTYRALTGAPLAHYDEMDAPASDSDIEARVLAGAFARRRKASTEGGEG